MMNSLSKQKDNRHPEQLLHNLTIQPITAHLRAAGGQFVILRIEQGASLSLEPEFRPLKDSPGTLYACYSKNLILNPKNEVSYPILQAALIRNREELQVYIQRIIRERYDELPEPKISRGALRYGIKLDTVNIKATMTLYYNAQRDIHRGFQKT